MKKYHFNPETGETGECRATLNCPFGGPDVHFPSLIEARRGFETSQNPLISPLKKSSAVLTFEAISSTPTPEDIEEIEDQLVTTFGNLWENRWDEVMGIGVKRTSSNMEIYRGKLKEKMMKDPSIASVKDQMLALLVERKAYGRAFKLGVSIDPKKDALFSQIWDGKLNGSNREKCEKELEEYKQMAQDLSEGKITPSSVVGTGLRNPRAEAERWIKRQIDFLTEALETEGRSASVNISNVEYLMRKEASSKN